MAGWFLWEEHRAHLLGVLPYLFVLACPLMHVFMHRGHHHGGGHQRHGDIAMGTGTDVAMNSAQVTLVKGGLRGISTARALSEATVANMKQNLLFAFIYNALGIPIAAGLLYSFTGWPLSPMIAALAMSLSSASVIANALRLRRG